jgi:hypothetical protein
MICGGRGWLARRGRWAPPPQGWSDGAELAELLGQCTALVQGATASAVSEAFPSCTRFHFD